MKKFLKFVKSDWAIYLFLALCILPRFWGLNNGLVLGEPDEFIHADVVANFAKSWWPTFSGGGWYFELPLYPFLGYLVSLVFSGRYLGLRLVSAFASLLLTFGFYAYFGASRSKTAIPLADPEFVEGEASETPSAGASRAEHGRIGRRGASRAKVDKRRLGFTIAFLWAISPFSIYYSRLALLDSWTIAFGMLGLFAFDIAIHSIRHSEAEGRRISDECQVSHSRGILRFAQDDGWVGRKFWSLLAGFLLGLAMLVKYTALIYLLVPMVYFGFLSLKETLGERRHPELGSGSQPSGFRNKFGMTLINFFKKISHLETVNLNIISFLTLAVVFLMTFPLMVILRQHEPYQFKLQTLTTLGFVRDFWRVTGGEITLGDYLGDVSWWLTWPVVVLATIGIVAQVKSQKLKVKSKRIEDGFKLPMVLWLGLFFTCLVVVPHTPFYPRYFLPLVPFVVIFAGIGFESLVILVSERSERIQNLSRSGFWSRSAPQNDKSRFTVYCLLFTVFFAVLILPTSIEAYKATSHNLIEDTGQYIKAQSKTENPWIFSNYWPHFFGRAAETDRATWLADSAWEAKAFVPDAEKSPLEIIKEGESFVILENLYSYSPMFISPPSRTDAWEYIKENYKPMKVIEDTSPNFPHFRGSDNKVFIYEF